MIFHCSQAFRLKEKIYLGQRGEAGGHTGPPLQPRVTAFNRRKETRDDAQQAIGELSEVR